jgi:hypothetical protein
VTRASVPLIAVALAPEPAQLSKSMKPRTEARPTRPRRLRLNERNCRELRRFDLVRGSRGGSVAVGGEMDA